MLSLCHVFAVMVAWNDLLFRGVTTVVAVVVMRRTSRIEETVARTYKGNP